MTAQDPALEPIAVKVARNQRLTRDDALELFNSPDLLTLGRLADSANRRLNGDRVHFAANQRSEEHTSELQSRLHLVCRLLLEKKKKKEKRVRESTEALT